MRRLLTPAMGLVMTLAIVSPVAAQAPDRWLDVLTTDPYVIAECDGYDVMEQIDVHTEQFDFFDQNADFVRHVSHSASTGVDWRSDTNEQVATYNDQGGIFIATSDNVFTFTGIHNAWTLNDGTVLRDLGRIVFEEVVPGEFEVVFDAGRHDERDPCTW
jgi:hypothetical protein